MLLTAADSVGPAEENRLALGDGGGGADHGTAALSSGESTSTENGSGEDLNFAEHVEERENVLEN